MGSGPSLISYGLPGISTQVCLTEKQLQAVQAISQQMSNNDFVSLDRVDSKKWMGLRKENGQVFLQVCNLYNKFNCRALIDVVTGALTVIKGVDYPDLNDQKDAEYVANWSVKHLKLSYLEKNIKFSRKIDVDQFAKKTYRCLRQYPFQDNDYHFRLNEVEERGTIDCDDFALSAWQKFQEQGIPAKIVIIEKPYSAAVGKHAACLYRTAEGWKWLDNQGMGQDVAEDPRTLPARIYKKDVSFVFIDVKNTWLIGEIDPNEEINENWLISQY